MYVRVYLSYIIIQLKKGERKKQTQASIMIIFFFIPHKENLFQIRDQIKEKPRENYKTPKIGRRKKFQGK